MHLIALALVVTAMLTMLAAWLMPRASHHAGLPWLNQHSLAVLASGVLFTFAISARNSGATTRLLLLLLLLLTTTAYFVARHREREAIDRYRRAARDRARLRRQ